MKDRGALYVGLMMILFGGLFLLIQLSGSLLAPLGIRLGWGELWPFIILLAGLAFWLPIFVWWDRRASVAGLAIPGTIIMVNGLILLYQSLTGDWASWAYLWAFEPLSVGLGLLALYALGDRDKGLLVASAIVGGIGLLFFIIFASAFGGLIRILGPVALILIGILFLVRGARERVVEEIPEE